MKKENVTMLQDSLDLLMYKYNELLGKGSYNEALNVMKNFEMVIRQLQNLGENIIVPDNQFFDWYSVLKFFIETKQSQLIQLDYTSHEKELVHRGTGKTTALVRLSSDYRIPIYTKKYYMTTFNDRAKEFNLNPIIVTEIRDLNLRQYNQKNIILIDELNKEELNTDKYTIIGFEQFTKK